MAYDSHRQRSISDVRTQSDRGGSARLVARCCQMPRTRARLRWTLKHALILEHCRRNVWGGIQNCMEATGWERQTLKLKKNPANTCTIHIRINPELTEIKVSSTHSEMK